MEKSTFSSLLKKAASDFPDNLAVYAIGESEIILTHAQLRELVDHAAALLIASGVRARNVVALAFPNTVEFVIMFLAVIRCRATALLLDPAYSVDEFESHLSILRAKLLLTPQEGNVRAHSAALRRHIPDVTAELHTADPKITLSSTDIEPDLDSLSKVVNRPSDVVLLSSSFRTDRLAQSQASFAIRVQFSKLKYNLTESDSHVIVSPLYRADCLVRELLSLLVAGAAVAFPAATVATTTEKNETEAERGRGEEYLLGVRRHPRFLRYNPVFERTRSIIVDIVREPVEISEPEYPDFNGPRLFSYEELMEQNGSFIHSNKLGEGGSGTVYEAQISGTHVAVKFIKSGSAQGEKEFLSELTALSDFRHPNLVRLIGHCCEANKFVLIYEFVRGGTLDHRLFNKDGPVLPWEMRCKIAQGLASAVHYLHEGGRDVYVVHRDIKCGNVMLDENYEAKLGDFGLARLVNPARGPITTELMGTPGYVPRECFETMKASKETDVYGLGVVYLETATGRRTLDTGRDPRDLVRWVCERYGRGELLDAVDSRLCGMFDEEQVKTLMIVGLWCTHPIASSRPRIAEAMAVLNGEAKPPKLHLMMPPSPYDIDLDRMVLSGSETFSSGSDRKVSSGCFGFCFKQKRRSGRE